MVPAAYAHDPFPFLQHTLAAGWLDPVMIACSRACEGWAIALCALAVALTGERWGARAAIAAGTVLAALALDGATVEVLKRLVDLPRPLAVLGAAHVRVLLEPLRAHSMPSGHASAAAVLAAYAVRRTRRAGAAACLLAIAGGLSRVYVGAHWALDVVAGWCLGILFGLAAAAAARAVIARLDAARATALPARATP
ncbi:phosphatase PAP2 family protein [Anaeromyxobacter oryzae]|uniref:Phosphatidic acid phosphatase type 2/haloperoxidase domain-containing protein n=1 Tax=Anaeromyxobacter oryzae TaxID=2918170 RepID=A0ABN6MM34_9BACT|nr:phosphatase PAP2 family protein [Anaeromyxobacter oryzae]BDG02094.1 hypothetical protein AMOR_10900 [Anaeromyxobacter oryzae]